MKFLIPHVTHRDMVSSISYNSNIENKNKRKIVEEDHTFSKTRPNATGSKKQQTGDDSDLSTYGDLSHKISALIDQENEKSKEEKTIEKYRPLISEGFRSIREEEKFNCTVEIINYLEQFQET